MYRSVPRYCSTTLPIAQRAYMLNAMWRIDAWRNIAVTSRHQSPWAAHGPQRTRLTYNDPPGERKLPPPLATVSRYTTTLIAMSVYVTGARFDPSAVPGARRTGFGLRRVVAGPRTAA